MKTKLILSLALAFASASPAASLLCGVNVNTVTNQVIGNPTDIACGAIDAGAGNLITNVAIRLLGSFNDATENTFHQVQFSAAGPLGATHTIQTGIADYDSSGGPTVGIAVNVGTQILAASTVSITTTNLGGLPTPDNASIAVWLEYNTAPAVPEPGTWALLGSALVALGLYRRHA